MYIRSTAHSGGRENQLKAYIERVYSIQQAVLEDSRVPAELVSPVTTVYAQIMEGLWCMMVHSLLFVRVGVSVRSQGEGPLCDFTGDHSRPVRSAASVLLGSFEGAAVLPLIAFTRLKRV